ncbi:MAG: preprotein translocase subunit YajC [Sedimentisphaerales bacterium]|jgi:preprotein translocase subunit YajC
MENLWIIAQATETQGQSEVPAEPVGQNQTTTGTVASPDPNTSRHTSTGNSSSIMQLVFIVGIFVILYFIMFREPKKRQRQQQQMIQSLKKNDKVRTIGGIIGIIVDVKGDEVTLKVDESNNTKIKVAASAIGKNLSNEGQ